MYELNARRQIGTVLSYDPKRETGWIEVPTLTQPVLVMGRDIVSRQIPEGLKAGQVVSFLLARTRNGIRAMSVLLATELIEQSKRAG